MANVIKAVFTGRFCTTRRVFRWDTDDVLQLVNLNLPTAFTVDFSNSLTGTSVPVLATSDTVQIPPEMFVPGSEIYAWVWISGTNGGYTKCQATIPIDQRAQRTGTEPTPAEQSAWDEAVDTLNDTVEGIPDVVESALTEAKESGEFDGADGENGATFTPTVSSAGVISWTNDKGLPNPVPVSIKGPQGAQGETGPQGPAGEAGAKGDTGQQGAPGVGVPSGGTTGQVLKKASGTDYDTEWADESGGGGGTSDYSDLTNKPSINSVTLTGNKSLSDLGIAAATAVPAAATATPAAPGVAAVGTSAKYAREDHVHPYVAPSSDEVTWEGGDLGQVPAPADVTGAVEAVYDAIPTTAADVGAYALPSGGIPKTDLASAVQTSLGKADTALQSYTETDPTVPSWAKASSKPSYTASEVGAIAAPASPTSGDVLTYDGSAWGASAPSHQIPSGGNAGECLAKNSASNYDLRWRTINDWTPAGLMRTSGGTAAKVAEWSFWSATQYPAWLVVTVGNSNTYAGAITLKVNGSTVYPIYINGAASSATNYTLPAGSYFVYFDGSKFDFRTDGKLPGDIIGHADKDIAAPASPSTGDFLCWNGSAWAATTLAAWQGGNY